MQFPDLKVSREEMEENRTSEELLVKKLRFLFKEFYGLEPPIKVSGSTEKGTVLPRKYFGIDIDAAVLGDRKLVDTIAYRSDLFEGCQLFSMGFFEKFREVFPDAYFAGHRLSGSVRGIPFDFAIADKEKDMWKWDYNGSKYLRFDEEQVEEVKKAKFFLKRFNVSGSEVYGIVGPAVELGIYSVRTFDRFLEKLGGMPKLVENDIRARFRTIRFPPEFYGLFLEEDNDMFKGLVDSFRYTTPNTFNRVIEATRLVSLNLEYFIEKHDPKLNYSRRLRNNNDRTILYFTSTAPRTVFENVGDLQILRDGEGIIAYASLNGEGKQSLDELFSKIDQIPVSGSIPKNQLDAETRKDIEQSLDGEKDYVVFVGRPDTKINRDVIYIPFDILMRSNAKGLIKVMEEGQSGA